MARKPGSKELLRRYLLAHVGEVVTSKLLQAASGGAAEWGRRVRELRDEEGWPIITHNDDAKLKPGEYRLLRNPPANYKFTKAISKRLRSQVLHRNGLRCYDCGAAAGEIHPYNKKPVQLHVDHIQARSHGGKDEMDNLRTLCSVCNEGGSNSRKEPVSGSWLYYQVRNAKLDEQHMVYKFLIQKFGKPDGED